MRVEVKRSSNREELDRNVEQALRTFKRKVNRDGILQEVRKREFYIKPGVKRRMKHEAALKARRTKKNKGF